MTSWTDDEIGGTVWSDQHGVGVEVSPFATTLLDDADAATARATLDAASASALAASSGSSLVGTIQSGTAQSETVQALLRRKGHDVKSYGAVGDGTTDDTAAIQKAITASAAGELIFFPAGTYLVTPVTGQNYCLLMDTLTSRTVMGFGATIKMTSTAGKQALRVVSCTNVTIERGLIFQGPGTDGADGAQGLVQFSSCTHVQFYARVIDADCDGVAFASCTDVEVGGSYDNCSKSSVYPNDSTDVTILPGTTITNGGGHTVSSAIVGTGVQMSGCTRANARGVIIRDLTGTGIRCNNSATNPPIGNVIEGCNLYNIANATNTAESIGIRLTNGHATKGCGTVVKGNFVKGCGLYSYYFENHDGLIAGGNTGIESVQSNFVIATINDVQFDNNVGINTNTSGAATKAAFHLINLANRVHGSGNRAITSTAFTSGSGTHGVRDQSTAKNNALRVIAGGLSTDNGDAAKTIAVGVDEELQRWATTLTAARAITLSTAGAYHGAQWRIERTGAGDFLLNVGTGPLAALAAGEWCVVKFDALAGAWSLSSRSALGNDTVGADVGNAAKTLTVGVSEMTQVWNTVITADRAVTLNTGAARNGDRFRIVRTASATGAFNINVGTGPLKAMGTAGSYCVVQYNGSAWALVEYGTL